MSEDEFLFGIIPLTKVDPVSSCLPDKAATTTEIEITPEMADAGGAALARFSSVIDSYEDGAIAVFRAMLAARNPKPKE